MRLLSCPAALCLTALYLTAAPAFAETRAEKADRCGIQTGIVEAAIGHRNDNSGQARATRKILGSDPIKGTKYEANVDVLVAWIYTLPTAQLNADTVTTFQKACLDYK